MDLLAELGLGIHRRLNEERRQQREALVDAADVSWWYLAPHLGKRFLKSAEQELATTLEPVSAGIWRCQVLRRLVFLVSSSHLPVERDSLPLHVLKTESEETELAIARLIGEEPALWERYIPWVAAFHEAAKEELFAMTRTKSPPREPDPDFLIELYKLGVVPGPDILNWLIEKLGREKVIEKLGPEKAVEYLLGPEKVLEALGPEKVFKALGPKRVLAEVAVDDILDALTPAQRKELKRRLR